MAGQLRDLRVVVLGPVPPPYTGVSVITEGLLQALPHHVVTVHHVNTTRPLRITGLPAAATIAADMARILRVWFLVLTRCAGVVYFPLSQRPWGLVRDGVMVALSKVLGARVVAHLHGSYLPLLYDRSPRVLKALLRMLVRDIDVLIVLGRSVGESVTKALGSSRFLVVPNGVPEPPVFAPWITGEQTAKPGSGGPLRVVFLSSLMEAKGVYDLLEALRLVHREGHAVVATVAGTNVEGTQEELLLRARALGISDIVTFRGPLTGQAKWDILACSHVFVLPSWDEGQPLAILEAMAVGLPVISTTVGAIPDAVQEGINGYVVPPRSPRLLADALVRFAQDPESISRMGRESRRRYVESFRFEDMVARLVRIMHEVMAQGRS